MNAIVVVPDVSRVILPEESMSSAPVSRLKREDWVFNVVAPPSAIVRMSVPLSWNCMMWLVPLWFTKRPTLSEFVFSSKEMAEMLSRIYLICVVFVEETATVLFWLMMKSSRAPRREFVKERLEEEIVFWRKARPFCNFETSPSMTRSWGSSPCTLMRAISFRAGADATRWTTLPTPFSFSS